MSDAALYSLLFYTQIDVFLSSSIWEFSSNEGVYNSIGYNENLHLFIEFCILFVSIYIHKVVCAFHSWWALSSGQQLKWGAHSQLDSRDLVEIKYFNF